MSSQTEQLPKTNVHLLKRWTFTPPHGMRFVNEMGSDVTAYFEAGREQELYQSIFIQLQQHLMNHLTSEKPTDPILTDNHKIVETVKQIVSEEGDTNNG